MGEKLTAYGSRCWVDLEWKEIDISEVTNTSVISWELIFHTYDTHSSTKNNTAIVTIDGTQKIMTIPKGDYPVGAHSIGTGTKTITRNADGTKTIEMKIYFTGSGATWDTKLEVSGSRTLITIDRRATITSAPDFTDIVSPTIYYNNPAQNSVTSLQACISSTGEADDIAGYRDINKTGSSYTFALTSAEKSRLYALVKTGRSVTVRFYVRTIIDGLYYFSYVTKTFTIENPEPTLAPTVKDVNARTLALTGNANTFIKYHSNAQYSIGAAAVEGATITSQYIINGAQRVDNKASGTIESIESNTFYVSASDSRGFSANEAITVNLIPYVKLTSQLYIESFTATGALTFTIKGKYFNGSFGAKSNSLDIDFQYQAEGEDVSQVYRLIDIKPTVDSDNNYSYSYTITGLKYTKTYELSVYVIDELSVGKNMSIVIAPTPVFDWGKDGFRHNTDIDISPSKSIYGITKDGMRLDALNPCNNSGSLVVGWGGYNNSVGKTDIMGNNVYITAKDKIYMNGSVLADFIIEQASNGIWHYKKWSSGRVELSGYQNINNLACNTALGGWYRTAVLNAPAFPFTVNNPKTVVSYESNGYGALVWLTTLASSSKPADFYLIRPTSSAGISGVVNYYITGTWK